MNSIQNLKHFRKLSFSTLLFIITLVILSTLASTFVSRAHTQAQYLREHTTKQHLLLEKIGRKSSAIIIEMNYSIVDKRQIIALQSSIKSDIDELKLMHNSIHQDQSNSATFTFHQEIQKQILKIIDLNVKYFINEDEKLTSIKPTTQENQLHL